MADDKKVKIRVTDGVIFDGEKQYGPGDIAEVSEATAQAVVHSRQGEYVGDHEDVEVTGSEAEVEPAELTDDLLAKLKGTVPEVEKRIAKLSLPELLALQSLDEETEDRVGVRNAINDRIKELQAE